MVDILKCTGAIARRHENVWIVGIKITERRFAILLAGLRLLNVIVLASFALLELGDRHRVDTVAVVVELIVRAQTYPAARFIAGE